MDFSIIRDKINLRKEFQENQKRINSRKTSKDERIKLIKRNKEIINSL